MPREVACDAPTAKFVATRTIAATIIADTASRCIGSSGGGGAAAAAPGADDAAAALATRELTVAVEWCTLGATELPPDHPWSLALRCGVGAMVKRQASAISACDVFRVAWEDEGGRWTVGEELAASWDAAAVRPAGGGGGGAGPRG